MSPHQETPSSASSTGFGPNEWLVDEIYQQYLQDPASVDRAWWDFFADYKPGTEVTPVTQAATPVGAQPTPVAAPAAAAPAAPAAPAPVAPAPAQPVAAPAAPPAPKAAAAAPAPAAAPAKAAEGPERVVLRGPAKAVASNMDASLEVPTATSVRAVPAKLLIDNRIVINNHL
ncbi:2-oxoglutarate dehydrogenase E1 subunit family protein, partial [Kitasatospora phosalacinea]|uniref:2-oxoglutarate dehydrogenase E1 subunit family protein n=2 Tax=Kitasatospora phosalacinea TaxID=2065 RepID=UPI003EB7E76F